MVCFTYKVKGKRRNFSLKRSEFRIFASFINRTLCLKAPTPVKLPLLPR